ncbi:ABC transporter permease subunit [Clostridium sp. MCC353]|uniref:ABC transporter permease n=1 Tax=Clostridium sp. MCC353 TaxID=2592646 RepID=UPI001C00E1AE|nr:ABC transporter permease subunit [Clostridium sp. MCC353]MBT9775155.1 ABC transporter permease subunit [Clostridium sp. MCC353]
MGIRIKKLYRQVVRHRFAYLLMAPGILFFLVFNIYPLYFLQIAFKKYSVFGGLENAKWVGLDNFRRLFATKYFGQALGNTLILSFCNILVGMVVPVAIALFINELRNRRFARFVQTSVYLPHFLSWVIAGGIWLSLLSPQGGLVNEFLGLFGIEPIFFAARPDLFRGVLVFTYAWKSAGWQSIIYLAAVTGIDSSLYEAARIDGADRMQCMKSITIPLILPTISVVTILQVGKVLELFNQVFVMYNPVVAEVSETLGTYVYNMGIVKGDMSFATTLGLFKSLVSVTLVLVTNKISKKLSGNSVV